MGSKIDQTAKKLGACCRYLEDLLSKLDPYDPIVTWVSLKMRYILYPKRIRLNLENDDIPWNCLLSSFETNNVMPSAQKTQLEHLDFTYPVAPWYLMFDP